MGFLVLCRGWRRTWPGCASWLGAPLPQKPLLSPLLLNHRSSKAGSRYRRLGLWGSWWWRVPSPLVHSPHQRWATEVFCCFLTTSFSTHTRRRAYAWPGLPRAGPGFVAGGWAISAPFKPGDLAPLVCATTDPALGPHDTVSDHHRCGAWLRSSLVVFVCFWEGVLK